MAAVTGASRKSGDGVVAVSGPGHSHTDVVCSVCGEDHPFEMPKELLDAALSRQLVVFAGAGISTESSRAVGDTFAGRILMELDDPKLGGLRFPALMSEYQQRFGRRQLLQRIRERFDYIKGFPALQRAATRFHRELATAYFLDQIVTTNWDTYFEDFAGATPLVTPADYAFWDLPGRKVFKLHGSMHNLGTIVATEADYARCYRSLRTRTLGSSFKHLLATKRVVFVGYSFGDDDLQKVLTFMRKELGEVLPQSYVVTPHGYGGQDFPDDRVIKTDGSYFIRQMKELAIERRALRPDWIYDLVADLADSVGEARHRVVARARPSKYPSVIFTWAYQDGLLHALERIMALRATGQYSDPLSIQDMLHTYEHARRGAIHLKNFFDAAYIEGYQNGLMAIEIDPETVLKGTPRYFVFGNKDEMVTFAEYMAVLKRAAQLRKGAEKEARRLIEVSGGLDPVHTPYLNIPKLVEASRPKPSSNAAASRPRTRSRTKG